MYHALRPALPALILLAAAPGLAAQTVTFESIFHAAGANDMSPDGRYIVGDSDQDGNGFADGLYLLDWQTQVMTILPSPGLTAVAVSDDGSVVLGSMPDPDTGAEVAAIWTAADGWVSLGYLPDASQCPSLSNGYELSGDGTVAVGLSWDGCSGRGFVWTQADGMLELEPLANGGNRASVVSGDGTVMGGFAQGTSSRTPAFWNDSTAGTLLDPPNGDALGEIYGVNDAGTLLLGSYLPAGQGGAARAVTWTYPGLVLKQLGAGSLLPAWEGIPMDIADNGTVVGFDFLVGARRAWIMPDGLAPLVDLHDWVEAHGGVVPDGMILEVCQAISADGTSIIGHGFGTGAWRVTIESACPWDCDGAGDGVVGINDFLELLAQWGSPGSCDFDGSGVGINDFLELLANWGECP